MVYVLSPVTELASDRYRSAVLVDKPAEAAPSRGPGRQHVVPRGEIVIVRRASRTTTSLLFRQDAPLPTVTMTEITDTGPEDMDHRDLLAEWREIQERQINGTPGKLDYDELHDRQSELWNEMKERTDAEPPECPRCDGQSWGQEFGDPKTCIECDLHLGEQHDDLIEEVDAYWRAVKSPPDADAEQTAA